MSGVEIRVRSDSRPAQRDLARLDRSIRGIAKSAKTVERAIQAIGTAFAFAFAGDALTRASDKFIELENRIALVTGRTKELSTTLDQLYNVSLQTRSGIETSVETFNRFGRALDGVGATELVGITKTIQQAVAISGAGTESARAALFQLGQGLAAGELRGQELNSVLEQTPRVAQAIADSMDVPIGALRKLAEQGALTTEVVFNAVKSQSDVIAQEFLLTQGTVGQSLTVLFDQFGRIVGQFDKITLAIGSVSYFFRGLAETINLNANLISVEIANAFSIVESTTYGLGVVFQGLAAIVGATFGRVVDALPRVILPMRTLRDDIDALAVFGLARLGTAIAFVAGSLEAFVSDVFGLNLEGTIFRLFQARSLIEFGRALESLADVISSYGQRWYNVSNFIEKGIRSSNFALLNTGIYLGIVDQKLLAFRYVSFERFGKVVGVVGDLFKALLRSIFALDGVAYIITGLLVVFQQLRRTFEAFLNIFSTGITSTRDRIEGLFSNISFGFIKGNTSEILEAFGGNFGQLSSLVIKNSDFMAKSWGNLIDAINEKTTLLGRAKSGISNFAQTIKNLFRNIYDKIIGNSYWTDTMEGVYTKAVENLRKTISVIKNFLKDAANRFSKIDFKELALNAKVSFTDSNIVESATEITKVLIERLKQAVRSVAVVISDLFKSISDVFPKIADVFSLAVTGALLAALTPALFAKIGITFALGLLSAVAGNVSDTIGKAIIDSDFFSSLGRGIGSGVGVFVNTVIKNIPVILTGLFQFAKEFGKALINEITGAFGIIPRALSDATFGLFDTIFGAIVASAGFSLLTVGFTKTMQRIAGILGAFVSTKGARGGIMETAIFGAKGVAGARAQNIAGVLGILTAVSSLTGGYTNGGPFAEAALTGGLLGFYLFGMKGVNFLAQAARQTMGQIVGTITGSMKDIAKSGAMASKGININNILSDFQSGNFSKGLKSATAAFNVFKANISAGKFDTAFTSSLANLGDKFSSQFKSGKFTGTIEKRFQGLGATMGNSLAKGFGKSKGLVIIGATLASFVGSAQAAEAATASTGAQVNHIIDLITDNILEIGYFGLLGLSFFGPGGFAALFRLATKSVLSLGKLLFSVLTSNAVLGGAGGIINGLIFGSKAVGKGGGVSLGPILGGLTSVLGGIFKSLGSILLRLVPLIFSGTGLLVGAVGLLGIILFGEGDGIFDKISNFGSALRSAITGTTKEGRRFKKEIDGLLKFDKVGEIEIDLKSIVDSVELNSISETGFREIKRSLQIANRTFEANQDKFDELGELTSLEDTKTRAAIRKVEEAVNRVNLTEVQDGVFGKLVQQFKPDEIGNTGFNFIQASPVNETDTPQLIAAFKAAVSDDATNKEQVTYLRDLATFLKDSQTSEFSAEQSAVVDALSGFGLLFALVEDGIPITIDNKRMGNLASIVSELETAIEEISKADRFANIITLEGQQAKIRDNLDLIGQLKRELLDINAFVFFNSQMANSQLILGEEFKEINEQLKLFNALVPDSLGLEPLSETQFYSLTPGNKKAIVDEVDLAFSTIKNTFEEAVRAAYKEELGGEFSVGEYGTSKFNAEVAELVETALSDGLSIEDLALYKIDTKQFSKLIANALFVADDIVSESESEIEEAGKTLETRINEAIGILGDNIKGIELGEIIDPKSLAQNETQAKAFIKMAKGLDETINDITLDPIARAKFAENSLQTLMNNLLEFSDQNSLLTKSLTYVDDPIDEKDLYSKDLLTRQEIQSLTLELLTLDVAIQKLKEGGVTEDEIPFFAKYLLEIDNVKKVLEKLITKPIKGGKTIFEKFVGGLSDSGFKVSLEEASRLSSRAVSALQAPLKKVKDAQDAIVKSSLKDSKGRRSALETITSSRKEISKIFQAQDVASAQKGLEGLGLDPNLVFESKQVLGLAEQIANKNIELGLVDNDNLTKKKQLTAEIERQVETFEILTTKSEEAYTEFKDTFGGALKELIKGETTIKGFFDKLLDGITNQIIDSVVNAFVTAMFRTANLENTFETMFASLGLFGQSVGEQLGADIGQSTTKALEASSAKNGSNWLSNLFGGGGSNPFSMIGSLFGFGGSGGTGPGANMGSIFSLFSPGGWFGLNAGGIVPNTRYSRLGQDSVPAMLTPGELVVPANKVNSFVGSGSSPTVVNLSITGDVSRQTKSEIVKMLPQIASGVNAQNKERNFKYS
jgi:tape measure domain-containing protein